MPAGQAAVSRAERRSGSATETTADYNGTPHKNLREEPHKRTRRPASGTVEPRQPVKGALRQPARRNGVMEIQENQPDSAGSRQKNKKQKFHQTLLFYFFDRVISGRFPEIRMLHDPQKSRAPATQDRFH